MPELPIVDFHAHYRPPWWDSPDPDWRPLGPDSARSARLDDTEALASDTADGGITLRLLSAPIELLYGPHRAVRTDKVNLVNDYLRATVDRHPDRFLGLATVDAYSGDAGAEQARYAIEDLGLHGLVIDSARHGLFAGSPLARPTLEVAASLGVPVFVHPVFAPDAEPLITAAGPAGNSFGRGVTNGTSLLSVLHAGIPDLLPDLNLVFTALSAGALLFAADAIAEHRRIAERAGSGFNLYLDTLRLDPPTLRYLVDVLGPERVLVGSDWPMRLDGRRDVIIDALRRSGFVPRDIRLITSDNARRILRPGTAAAPVHDVQRASHG